MTGKLVGWVLSRERPKLQGADVVNKTEGNIKYVVIARHAEPCAVGDPMHARKHLAVSERACLSLVTGIGRSHSQLRDGICGVRAENPKE